MDIDSEGNPVSVRGNAYPHWGLKPKLSMSDESHFGEVRGNAYPHWGLKRLTLMVRGCSIHQFEVMPIPIGD